MRPCRHLWAATCGNPTEFERAVHLHIPFHPLEFASRFAGPADPPGFFWDATIDGRVRDSFMSEDAAGIPGRFSWHG